MKITPKIKNNICFTDNLIVGVPLTFPNHVGQFVTGRIKRMFMYKDIFWIVLETTEGVRTVKML